MVLQIWVNIGSRYGLLPDNTKPLLGFFMNGPWWNLAEGNFTKKVPDITYYEVFENYTFEILLNLPTPNELEGGFPGTSGEKSQSQKQWHVAKV